MAKWLIEDVKVGESKGGIACGPVGGHIVAELQLRDTEEDAVSYYGITEVEGTVNLTESDQSLYDIEIEEDYDDKAAWEKVSNAEAGGYCDYHDFYEDIYNLDTFDEDNVLIWKLLAYFVRASWEEIDAMKAKCIGKALEEIEIPICDAEQDYLDEQEE